MTQQCHQDLNQHNSSSKLWLLQQGLWELLGRVK
jgi:hypothetical protein